jgi:hypothetical protein
MTPMKIKPAADLLANPDEWRRQYHDLENAAVAKLVKDGIAGRPSERSPEKSRDAYDDDLMRRLFQRQYKPQAERSKSDQAKSADAYLYEGVTSCIQEARLDERKRIAKALSGLLQKALGEEFADLLVDLAEENGLFVE